MTSSLYETALDNLAIDIRQAASEEADLSRRLADARERLRQMRRAASSFACLLGKETPDIPKARDNGRPPRHADVAARVLMAEGRPMRVPEIGERMAALGHALPEDRNIRDSAIFSAMKRRPRMFVSVERGVWALAK
ncbi:MAG: hypothetical protein AB7G11_11125 [Phycisphaerales bacterium]